VCSRGNRGPPSLSVCSMNVWNAFGYLAATLIFTAFFMETMRPLRLLALGSNIAFIAYGIGLNLTPVWLLHSILLPLNGWRLFQARRSKEGAGQRQLDQDLLNILSPHMVERRLDAGAKFVPSSAERELYYIIEGAVLVGHDRVRLGAGEIVDSSWFSLPRSVATDVVICLTNVRLQAATAAMLEQVCNENPRIAVRLLHPLRPRRSIEGGASRSPAAGGC
jgi:CRP/FNR family transcriptional regulator, cyclic AMP receptor protein